MVMNFWEAKRKARRRTTLYLCLFVALTIVAAGVLEFGMRYWSEDPFDTTVPIFGLLFMAITFIASFVQYTCFLSSGGAYVAESMDGRLADPAVPKEAQLLNIVEECALASSLPVPQVYIIDADQINAFAAGLKTDDAVIAVTTGALELLSRDEMQGVVAHEFGHIANGDMLIGLRLAAMLMGFYCILYLALRMLQFSGGRRSDSKGQNPVLLAAFLFLCAGAFAWLFGSILKAAVSRQREYLADASSVQYTRNPQGLIGALLKIENQSVKDMPQAGMAYSHLYLDDHGTLSSLFATHPPINKRIKAIEGD
ncbi:MAG: M48 family metallopeptidase [Chlamydiales bacterium]|nr:M48 family metallopeptidase [Chlamydiales bacterium]